jgi:ubiquinone/menaquinone biosynthesis C-methylase UbiE
MICDYEGSDYQSRFWKNADRAYEDAVERVAIQRLLPPKGERIAEFGAGFGRLGDLYTGYDQIILLDYSRSLLEEAMQKWGDDPRFLFVAADIYRLPFAAGVLSAATMIRVIHHIADVPAALRQIRKAIAPNGTFVLEFANKRNLKSMARHAIGKQSWSPYSNEPIEFVKLNFDFHPKWMIEQVRRAEFEVKEKLSASYLRAGLFKRAMSLKAMVKLDSALQRTASAGLFSPSVFLKLLASSQKLEHPRSEAKGTEARSWNILDAKRRGQKPDTVSIFRSPNSGGALRREGDVLVCDEDGTRWSAKARFFDFKTPL